MSLSRLRREVDVWIADALEKLSRGSLVPFDFSVLRELLASSERGARQRILYLYAKDPALNSKIVAWTLSDDADPSPLPQQPPYQTVGDAIKDGWRAIQFPVHRPTAECNLNTLIGSEFILERWDQDDAC